MKPENKKPVLADGRGTAANREKYSSPTRQIQRGTVNVAGALIAEAYRFSDQMDADFLRWKRAGRNEKN